MNVTYLFANWSAPKQIHALTTTKSYGHSLAPYEQNNLALHVGDDPSHVIANRSHLKHDLDLINEPQWLEQVHSNICVVIEETSNRLADAAVTRQPHTPLAIMTADCLPIVLCNQNGTEIAAIHAGWRGLASGIIENTLEKMHSAPSQLMAWIGPAICRKCFQIGVEVKQTYLDRYPQTEPAFFESDKGLYANLPQMASLILNQHGVMQVSLSNACSFESIDQFYSYRRHTPTGRMATLIWF